MQDHSKQRTVDDKEILDRIREANADYISEQIRVIKKKIRLLILCGLCLCIHLLWRFFSQS